MEPTQSLEAFELGLRAAAELRRPARTASVLHRADSLAREALRIDPLSDGIAFWIHVTPRSRVAKVGGQHGDALRVAVSEPPVEGRANGACQRALSESLGLQRRQVAIAPSSRGRRKRVQATGDSRALPARLRQLATGARVG